MLVNPYLWDEGSLPEPLTIVTWADGRNKDIVAMVTAADNEEINLTDYWSVGDERIVNLASMPVSLSSVDWSVDESHAIQDVTLVIMNEGYAVTGIDNSHIHFVVGLKDCLNEKGYLTPAGEHLYWFSSSRRKWCNSIFYMSFPNTLKSIFKTFNTKTALHDGSDFIGLNTTEERFSLFASKEIFNTGSSIEEHDSLTQMTWYVTSSNRIKNVNGVAADWWERSVSSYKNCPCLVSAAGQNYDGVLASSPQGISPFGCI